MLYNTYNVILCDIITPVHMNVDLLKIRTIIDKTVEVNSYTCYIKCKRKNISQRNILHVKLSTIHPKVPKLIKYKRKIFRFILLFYIINDLINNITNNLIFIRKSFLQRKERNYSIGYLQ